MRQFRTIRWWVLAGALGGAIAAHAQHGGALNGGMGAPRMGLPNMNHGGRNNAPTASRPRGPQLGLSGRWWDEHRTIKSLNLRGDQKQRMDEVFASNKSALVTLLGNLKQQENALASMSKQDRQDEAKVFDAINRVETARGELAKEVAHVQLQIRQQLDPDQVTKLDQAIASQQ